MRKYTFALLAVFFVFALTLSASAAVLLDDFSFDGLNIDYKIQKWERTPGEPRAEIVRDPERGGVLRLSSADGTDMFVKREVAVKPDTVYRISAVCRSKVAEDKAPAAIWVDHTYVNQKAERDTNGEWVPIVFYGRTGEDQVRLCAGLRLGAIAGDSIGSADFDDFEITEVSEAPQGVEVYELAANDWADQSVPLPDLSNRLVNADFSAGQDAWSFGASENASATLSFENIDGVNSAVLKNEGIGCSAIRQIIACEPGAYYLVTGLCRTDGVNEGGAGAYITVPELGAVSEHCVETGTQLRVLSFFCKSDRNEITVELRLGDAGAPNVGSAAFSNIVARRIPALPEGANVSGFGRDTLMNSPLRYHIGSIYIAAAYLFIAFLVLKKVSAGRFSLKDTMPGMTAERSVLVHYLPLIGFYCAVLICCAGRLNASSGDMMWHARWADSVYASGITGFYRDVAFCDYPPLYILLLWPVGALRALLPNMSGSVAAFLIRLIPIAANAACLIVFCGVAAREMKLRGGLLLAALLAMEPAIVLSSADLGRADSLLILFVLLCVLSAEKGRYARSILFLGLALLTRQQASLLVLPVIVYIVARMIRDPRGISRVLGATAGVIVLLFIAGLICSGRGIAGAFAWIFESYIARPLPYRYQTYNAFNLYYLLGMNLADASAGTGITILSNVLAVLCVVFAASIPVLRKEKRGSLAAACGTLSLLLFAFAPRMHPRCGLIAIALLFVAAVQMNDYRPVIGAVITAAVLFVNQVSVSHAAFYPTAAILSAVTCAAAVYTACAIIIAPARSRTAENKLPRRSGE